MKSSRTLGAAGTTTKENGMGRVKKREGRQMGKAVERLPSNRKVQGRHSSV
jgi:hypothetical protein